jgi:hypothetical protein
LSRYKYHHDNMYPLSTRTMFKNNTVCSYVQMSLDIRMLYFNHLTLLTNMKNNSSILGEPVMVVVHRYPISSEQYTRIMDFIDNYAGKIFYGRMDLLYKLLEYLRIEQHSVGIRVDSIELVLPGEEKGIVVLDSGWWIEVKMDEKGYWIEFHRPQATTS